MLSNVHLGLNSVVVDSVAIPGLAIAVNDPLKFVGICDISDNVSDTGILLGILRTDQLHKLFQTSQRM